MSTPYPDTVHVSRRTLLALGVSLVAGACSASQTGSGGTGPAGSASAATTTPPSVPAGDPNEAPSTGAGPTTTEYDPLPDPPLDGAVVYERATNPFSLGVASGDPTPYRVVLWTRLAPQPLEVGGGMDAQSYRVDWEVALDESFEEIAFSGTARADAEHAHSVHVDLREVEPAVGFFYRFRAGTHVSPVGRMATMPLFTLPDRVVIGTVSRRGDQMALSPLLADVARSGLDLLIDLGDPMPGRPETTLEQYRSLYAASLADASSRTAHAACTWLATRSGVDISSDAARKAWWEHSAVRLPPPAPGEPFPTYRHCLVGSLVDIVLLDPTVDGSEANRLGRAQERWLTRVPARTNTAWHAIAYRGDPAVGERATQLLTAASVRNVVTLAPAGAPDGAIAWQRHEVTPERWTSATHVLDVASGRITVSDRPTEVVASPPADTTG